MSENQYFTFINQVNTQYGQNFLDYFQIYDELKYKIKRDKLDENQITELCSLIYQLMQDCLNPKNAGEDTYPIEEIEDKPMKKIEKLGFLSLFKAAYMRQDLNEVLDKLKTEEGYNEFKERFTLSSNPYELNFILERESYGSDFSEKMNIYKELRRNMLSKLSLDEIENIITAIPQILGEIEALNAFTSVELAHLIKRMDMPITDIPEVLQSEFRKESFLLNFQEQYDIAIRSKQILFRIRNLAMQKFGSVPQFLVAANIDHNFLTPMKYNGLPSLSGLIKAAYTLDTTIEYLMNGTDVSEFRTKVPIETLLQEDKYDTNIFKNRLWEYCELYNIKIPDMAIQSDLSPMTDRKSVV